MATLISHDPLTEIVGHPVTYGHHAQVVLHRTHCRCAAWSALVDVLGVLLVERPSHYRVRRDTIDASGTVTLRYLGKLRHIAVGARHRHRKVHLLTPARPPQPYHRWLELLRAPWLDPLLTTNPGGGPPTMSHDRCRGRPSLSHNSGGRAGIRTREAG
ncbi:MAG: hypothetical protein ACRENM_05650 [Candidatus Dormibacteraceae bacterium]